MCFSGSKPFTSPPKRVGQSGVVGEKDGEAPANASRRQGGLGGADRQVAGVGTGALPGFRLDQDLDPGQPGFRGHDPGSGRRPSAS